MRSLGDVDSQSVFLLAGKIGNGLVMVAFVIIGEAAGVVGTGVLRIDLNGLGIVGNGLVRVAFVIPGFAAVEVGFT